MTRYFGRGDTTEGNLVLLWPDKFPDGAQQKLAEDPFDVVDPLLEEDSVIALFDTTDGEYSVAIYVDQEPESPLSKFLEGEEEYPLITVQGKTFFGGIETLGISASDDKDEAPPGFAELDIPDGNYRASVYRPVVPPAYVRQWLIERLGIGGYRVLHWQALLSKASLVGGVVSFFALFMLKLVPWLFLVGAVFLTLLVSLLLSKSESCRNALIALEEFSELYPDYVVVLTSIDALPEPE